MTNATQKITVKQLRAIIKKDKQIKFQNAYGAMYSLVQEGKNLIAYRANGEQTGWAPLSFKSMKYNLNKFDTLITE